MQRLYKGFLVCDSLIRAVLESVVLYATTNKRYFFDSLMGTKESKFQK